MQKWTSVATRREVAHGSKAYAVRQRGKWMRALAMTAAMGLVASAARAGTPYYWDGGTTDLTGNGDGVSQGGAGTWNTTIQNWDPGAGLPYVAWPNTTASDAVFAGTPGLVTLGTSIVAGNVSIGGATAYTIATGANTLSINNGITVPTTGFMQTISGTGGLVVSGGTGGGQTFNIASGSTVVISGLLSGSDTITNSTAGRIGLTGGTNTFTGKYIINAGVLSLTSDAQLGAVPGAATADYITLNGGLLEDGIANAAGTTSFGQSATFTINANRGITLGASGGTFQIGYGATNVMTVAGIISGAGGLTKPDSGTLALTNAGNSYAGVTTINGGVIAVTANGALGTTAGGTTINGSGTLDLQNVNYSTAETLTQNGGTIAVSTGTSTFAGNVASGGTAGTVNVTGTALTISGAITASASGGVLNKTGAGTLTISGTGDNAAGRLKVTTGTLVLAKTSSGSVHSVGTGGGTDYALQVAGGTAQLGGTGGDQIYFASSVSITGGTFDMNGLSEGFDGLYGTGGTILNNGTSAATLTLGQNNSNGSPTFSGTLANGTGTLALVKAGTGTQTLAAANTYTGGTTASAGVLAIGAANAIPSTGTFSFTGGTLDANGFADSVGPLSITSGASTLKFGAAGDTGNVLTFASATLTSGTLTVTNWDGTQSGGGGDRFLVTANPSAATLAAISFLNPAGLAPGTYPATVVGSGPYEIVPTPEPAALGLLALTAVGALGRRRRRSRTA